MLAAAAGKAGHWMNNCGKPQRLLIYPDGYAREVGQWVSALQDCRCRTLRCLEGVTPAAVDWRPGAGTNRIGTLLYHIAAIEMDWLFTEILEQAFPVQVATLFPFDVRDDQGKLSEVCGIALEEHIQRLGSTRAILRDALRGMSAEELRRVRHLDAYDVTAEWILQHLLQHEAEHRGQIADLRRRFASSAAR
jgi:uncharacterized damage-inducible protein DinB